METRYLIPPVTLRVAKDVTQPGRVEHFHHSRKLLRRLDVIGQSLLVILEMHEGATAYPELKVDALNHFLRAGSGLKYFRRSCHWEDASSWRLLQKRVGLVE